MDREHKTLRRTGRAPTVKKPYVKPSYASEKIYETLALACGKLPGQGGQCNAAARNS